MKAHPPSGQVYRITRRWVPWRRKTGEFDLDLPDLPSGDDPISAILLGILLVVFVIPGVILTIVAAVEFALLLLLLPAYVLARVIFGRRWVIEVRRGFTPIHEERAGDWRASGVHITEFAREIESGNVPADTLAKLPQERQSPMA